MHRTAAAIASAFTAPPVDIAGRALAALASWGFAVDVLEVERLGGVVRLVLPDGPAMAARLTAAGAALQDAGLASDVHAGQRAVVAYSAVLVGEPPALPASCGGCARGRCVAHAPLFAELDL